MAKDQSRQERPRELRRRAEEALSRKKTGEPSAMPEEDVRALVHELQVHQIELEMQNEELKRANAMVEETRNRYVDLYELAPIGYLTLDENGIVIEANLTAAGQLGIERRGLLKRPFQDYIVPADRDKFRSHLNKVVTSEKRQSCEIGLMTKSSGDFYALLDTLFILDSSGKKLCRTTATDITERKLFEDTRVFLAQSGRMASSGEDFFESLARYLGQSLGMDYVCIDRLEGDLLSARTLAVYFDGKFEDNVTYTLKDTPCGEVVEKKICCFPKGVRHLFPKDEVLQEMKAESYVGTILWGSKGQPIGLIAVIGRQPLANRHLTESVLQLVEVRAAGELERKWVEEELRENRSRLNLALRSAHMGVWRLDLIENKRHFDDQVCHLLGIAPAKFTGTEEEFYKALHPDDREMLKAIWARTIEQDVPYEAEYRAVWPDGSVHYLTARGKLVHDDKGQQVSVNGIIWDSTERKRMEEELRKSHNLLEMRIQERTAELRESEERFRCLSGRLLAAQEEERKNIGREIHDSIGSSLAAVIFVLESARSNALQLDGKQIQDLLENPISITKKAIDETRRIHTGMRPPVLDDIGLIVAIDWYCREFQQSYPQIHMEREVGIEENEIPEPLKIVIFRILQESLNNVAKYSKAEFVGLAITKNGGTIEFAIEDNGIGFDLSAILSRADGNRGLGLASMRERASLAGGNLIIQSIPGEGTTIRGNWSTTGI